MLLWVVDDTRPAGCKEADSAFVPWTPIRTPVVLTKLDRSDDIRATPTSTGFDLDCLVVNCDIGLPKFLLKGFHNCLFVVWIDWYHDPRQPGQSNLVRLVNLKARVTDPSLQDVFKAHFPQKILYSRSSTEHDLTSYLLDFTRHTPRDFIQVLTHIQPFAPRVVDPALIRRPLSQDQVLSGMRSYSIDYFLPEIKDELVGYFSNDDVTSAIDLIGSMRNREFTFIELTKRAGRQKRFISLDLASMITALFECSAIGNVHSRKGRKGDTTYYTFKYRNRNSTLNLEDRLTLHRGMWKALNLI